jgi:hypothetical protein
MTERQPTADGRRRLQLTNNEREEFAERTNIERLVSMFLDLERKYTRAEMCEELDVTPKQLKRLTQTDLFKEIYDDHLATLGHDPRLQAVQAGLIDLLPEAFGQLREALTGADVPWTVKYKAIQDVLRLNGIQPKAAVQSDRKELAEFLGEIGSNVTDLHVHLPEGYEEAAKAAEDGEVVTVEATNIPDDEPPRQIDRPQGEPGRMTVS